MFKKWLVDAIKIDAAGVSQILIIQQWYKKLLLSRQETQNVSFYRATADVSITLE